MGHAQEKPDENEADTVIPFNAAAMDNSDDETDRQSVESILTLIHSRDIADPIRAAVDKALPRIRQAITEEINAAINGSISKEAKAALITMARQIATDRSPLAANAITEGIIDTVRNASKSALAKATDAVQQSARPVIVFGSGILTESHNPLYAVIHNTDIPFMCTSPGVEKAVYETPVCKGFFGDSYIGRVTDKADILRRADCVILIGDRGEHRDYCKSMAAGANIISFDIRDHTIRARNSHNVHTIIRKSGDDIVGKLSHMHLPYESRMAHVVWKKSIGKASIKFPAHVIS